MMKETYSDINNFWWLKYFDVLLTDLPPNFSVKINETDSIHLSFHKVASNVMDMIAHPQLITINRVQLELPKESMDPVLQPITQLELVQSEKKAMKFRFPNLQRLQVALL